MGQIDCPKCGTRARETTLHWSDGVSVPTVDAICAWCRHPWTFTASDSDLEEMGFAREAPSKEPLQVKEGSEGSALRIGAFYWMLPAPTPGAGSEQESQPQPARYEGDGRWTCLGLEGVTDGPAIWVGPEIVLPTGPH